MAKIIYRGKFDENTDNLPHNPHKSGAERFKEPDDLKKVVVIVNVVAIVLFAILAIATIIILKINDITLRFSFWAVILPMLTLLPHEFLHAICFKEEAYVYTYFSKGMLFVVGPESMSKGRFIMMSLLPNIIFGFIPYLGFLINPSLIALGVFGILCIAMGAGDYYNVINALTQMPKGAKTYLHKFNSYWYIE